MNFSFKLIPDLISENHKFIVISYDEIIKIILPTFENH